MSYSDFNIKKVQDDFDMEIVKELGFFSKIDDAQMSDYFSETLKENLPLAVAINTEKAKSELIISDVLIEIRKIFNREISFFSGVEFNIDKEKGLSGYCDFIVSLSPEQLFIKSPVIVIVEAKNENIMNGLGQCIAEMVAGKIFNERERNDISTIYGAVTTGIFWKFLKLSNNSVCIDLKDYSVEDRPGKILGILSSMVNQKA